MENTTNNAAYMLRVRDIHKSFQDNEVLKGISLDVCRGEVLSIIGPSGSGKSTLLRCLNRLETIDKGSIEVKGEFLVENDDSGCAAYAPTGKARALLGLGTSDSAMMPANIPPAAKKSGVAPWFAKRVASSCRGAVSMPLSRMSAALPARTVLSSTAAT